MRPLNPPIRDWRDRRVWLVGASSGIGAALARALAPRGARIAVSARRATELHHVLDVAAGGAVAAGLDRPPEMLALPLDVTDPPSLAAARDAIVAAWGGIDVVVWLAATWQPMRARNFDASAARRSVEVNQIGALDLLGSVLPMLLARRSGHLVLTASVAGWFGMPEALAYGPTKAALNHLAETLWFDLHPEGIGVTVVNPGFVDTPATATNTFPMPALMSADAAAERILAGLATGRFDIRFPRRFTGVLGLLRLLPRRCRFAAVRSVTGA